MTASVFHYKRLVPIAAEAPAHSPKYVDLLLESSCLQKVPRPCPPTDVNLLIKIKIHQYLLVHKTLQYKVGDG